MTHQELCQLAVKWLQRSPGRSNGPACQVAFSEAKCGWSGEIPDAIGFRTAAEDEGSVVVEVKTSWSDFIADRAKAHRQDPANGMGMYRYYLAPEGLIAVSDLPEHWGLVEVSQRGVMTVRAGHVMHPRSQQRAWRHEPSVAREWLLLASMLSRVGDVEALHSELKKAKNERTRLAKQCDAYAARERERNLSQAVAHGDASAPLTALRKRA